MGYYSGQAIEGAYHEDRSYPSPELQLKWRIEDLRLRLTLMSGVGFNNYFKNETFCRYSKDELAYIPPECFITVSDIIDALAIAEETLASLEADDDLVGLIDSISENNASEEMIPGQITFFDILQGSLFKHPV